jgi:hypothetical protein
VKSIKSLFKAELSLHDNLGHYKTTPKESIDKKKFFPITGMELDFNPYRVN